MLNMYCSAMTKTLDSTAVYAYTTLISAIVCTPFMIGMEGGLLKAGAEVAIAKVGAQRFYFDLFMVGLLYHLYNQVREGRGSSSEGGPGESGGCSY
jgi:diaminopimelate decarboxylase/solute carrier family 35 protein E1